MTTTSRRPSARPVRVLAAALAGCAALVLALAGCAADPAGGATATVPAVAPDVRVLPPEPSAVAAAAVVMPVDPSAPSAEVAAAEARVLELANQARAAAGVPPLERTPELDTVARDWSAHLAGEGLELAHNPDVGTLIPAGWSSWGENVGWTSAAGAAPTDVAASVHDGWMHSEGHRDNLLNPDFTQIGIGVAVGPNGWYLTQDFLGR